MFKHRLRRQLPCLQYKYQCYLVQPKTLCFLIMCVDKGLMVFDNVRRNGARGGGEVVFPNTIITILYLQSVYSYFHIHMYSLYYTY